MTEVSISTPHHQLKGYLATPEGEGPWPGVIVLHDIFGLTDLTRGHADWLAKEGYLAVALDLFSWGGRFRCIRALMADLSAREGAAFDDVDAVRQWLEGRQDCTGKTGVIGFCATASNRRLRVESIRAGSAGSSDLPITATVRASEHGSSSSVFHFTNVASSFARKQRIRGKQRSIHDYKSSFSFSSVQKHPGSRR